MDFAMIEGSSHRRWPVHGYLRRLNHPSVLWSTIQGAWNTTFDFYSRIDGKNRKWWLWQPTEQPPSDTLPCSHSVASVCFSPVLGAGLGSASNPEEVAAWPC